MRFSVAVVFIFLFVWSPELVSAQITIGGATSDTLYFKMRGNGMLKTVAKKKATRYMVQFYENGVLVERRLCHVGSNNLIQHKFYKDGRPSGKWQYFDEAGNIIRERDFSKLVYGHCEKADSIPPEGMVLPQFEGGDSGLLKYLSKKIKYPQESIYSHTTGTVYINF